MTCVLGYASVTFTGRIVTYVTAVKTLQGGHALTVHFLLDGSVLIMMDASNCAH